MVLEAIWSDLSMVKVVSNKCPLIIQLPFPRITQEIMLVPVVHIILCTSMTFMFKIISTKIASQHLPDHVILYFDYHNSYNNGGGLGGFMVQNKVSTLHSGNTKFNLPAYEYKVVLYVKAILSSLLPVRVISNVQLIINWILGCGNTYLVRLLKSKVRN